MQRVPNADFAPDLKKRLEELWGSPPNLYRALGNHPALAAAWTEFARAIRYESRNPRELRELMILRGAQLMRSEYEWAQHLRMARKAGVREAQIAALADWRGSAQFSEREKAALALAEAVTQANVTDEVYAEAAKHFDERALMSLILQITVINAWNRLNVATRQVAGEWLKSAQARAWVDSAAS